MSNFRSKAFNPVSKQVEEAEYCDDYYGRHRYGIRFDDGCVHPEAQCGIDAADTQFAALNARVKELEEIIASIREKSGVGGKPMLSELAEAVGSKLAEAEARATRLQQERDEAIRDAKRYRWLRDGNAMTPEEEGIYGGDDLDALCDAAIRQLASGPEKEGK